MTPPSVPPIEVPRNLVLPLPPSEEEKYSYIKRDLPLLLVTSILSIGCLTFSQIYLMRYRYWFLFFAPFLIFTLVQYIISYSLDFASRNFDFKTHEAIIASWTPKTFPSVDIWLPICGEELAVIANTWLHVKKLANSYLGSATVYVLDDGADSNAADLANSYGFNYLVRPNRGWMKKAGNLRHAYENSTSEFIAIFDANRDTPLHAKELTAGDSSDSAIFPSTAGTDMDGTWFRRGTGIFLSSCSSFAKSL
jgi:cellulose synthase (UDP-forming)